MTATRIRLRLFASASAAAGVDEVRMDVSDDPTIAGALQRLEAGGGDGDVAALAGADAPTDGLGRESDSGRTRDDSPARRDGRERDGRDDDLHRVLRRCSFLVNGIATTDRGTVLADDDEVDVMPPFAGG